MLQYIRRLIIAPEAVGMSDAHLLRLFVQHRDEKAFTALVQRHGPLVLGLCRRNNLAFSTPRGPNPHPPYPEGFLPR
jgi:hypothetical protein